MDRQALNVGFWDVEDGAGRQAEGASAEGRGEYYCTGGIFSSLLKSRRVAPEAPLCARCQPAARVC